MIYEEALIFINDMFTDVYMSRRKNDLKNFLIYLVNKKYGKKDKILRQINKTFLLKWKFYADLISNIIPIKPVAKQSDLDALVKINTEIEEVDTSISDRMIEEHKANLVIENEFRKLNPHIIVEKYKSHCSDIMVHDKELRQSQRKEMLLKKSKEATEKKKQEMSQTVTQTAKSLVKLDKAKLEARILFSGGLKRTVKVTELLRPPTGMSQTTISNLMSGFCLHNDKFIIRVQYPEMLYTGDAKTEVAKKVEEVEPEPEVHTLYKILRKDGMHVVCLDTNNIEYTEKLSYDKTNKDISLYPHNNEGFKIEEGRAYFTMHMKKGLSLMHIPYHISEKTKGDYDFVSSGEEALPLYMESVERKVINMPKMPINQQMINKWQTVKRKCQKPLRVKHEIVTYNKFEVLNQYKFDKVIESIYSESEPITSANKILSKKEVAVIKKKSCKKTREDAEISPHRFRKEDIFQ